MRLDKYLSDMGRGTRSELKTAIRKGRVTVDGEVTRDPGAKVTEASLVTFDGEAVAYRSLVYIMLNKPAGVISATEDSRERTVLDLIEESANEAGLRSGGDLALRKGLSPVGRLDRDTEGLLLITNDGALAHRLLSPKKHVDKVYYAELDRPVGEREVSLFAEGVEIRDDEPFTALPAELKILPAGEGADGDTITADGSPDNERAKVPGTRVHVVIREGKYHQVKRMFAAVGRKVLYLKRISMGPLVLDETLETGQWRLLTDEEIKRLT